MVWLTETVVPVCSAGAGTVCRREACRDISVLFRDGRMKAAGSGLSGIWRTERRLAAVMPENGLYLVGMARRLSWQGGKAGMVGTRFVWYGQTGIRDRVDVSGLAGRHQSGRPVEHEHGKQAADGESDHKCPVNHVSFLCR